MSKLQHRISLWVDGSLSGYVNPAYNRLVLQELEQEGEKFLRPTLDTVFTFTRSEYDYIESLDITKEVLLIVERIEPGGTYTEKYRGVFTKTDCEFEREGSNRLVKVKTRPRDDYETIIEALSKEYDVVADLAPEISAFEYKKRPIIQAYLFDSNFVTNYTLGNYWESPVTGIVNGITLINDYYFTPSPVFIWITGDASNDPDISGKYNTIDFKRDDGVYEIFEHSPGGGINRFVIREVSTGTWVYQLEINEPLLNGANYLEPGGTLKSNIDGGVSQAQAFLISVYLRYLTDQENIAGVPTFPLPENDIVGGGENYTRVIGLSADNAAVFNGHSTTPTPYGKYDESAIKFPGEYFTLFTPTGAPFVGPAYPLSQTDWKYFSVWFQFTPFQISTEGQYSTTLTVRHAYKLPDLIKAFLAKIDTTVTHEESAVYSNFFYSTSSPMRPDIRYPMFTPKSNVVIGEYEQPAKKAPLRLDDLMQFLKDFYGVYWFIRDGMFVLEQEEWFERGGAYFMDNVGADFTMLLEPKTGKPWTFRTNRWAYEKQEMPEREEYAWMDDQSRVFDGRPIEMIDPQVNKGQVESKAFARFSADLDYIIVNPSEISKDGFVFVEAIAGKVANIFEIPFVEIESDGLTLNVQNGYAAVTYAHEQYHRYQLPCKNVRINDKDTTAISIVRSKIQDFEYPQDPAASFLPLVTTGLGSGKIQSREIDLLSGLVKAKLKHEQ